MNSAPRAIRVSHPILRLEVLSRDGTRAARERVFCQLQRESMPVEVCSVCTRREAIHRGATPSVDCTFPMPIGPVRPDPQGERTEVASLLSSGVSVVEETAPLREALALMKDGRRSLAVVDTEQKLVGVVHEMAFARGGDSPTGDGDITWAMSTALAVHEAMPVRAALRLLASSHLREATVVSSEGRPLGVFRDVDGLRWIANRRGQ
jgi:CBS domain-containing protein